MSFDCVVIGGGASGMMAAIILTLPYALTPVASFIFFLSDSSAVRAGRGLTTLIPSFLTSL